VTTVVSTPDTDARRGLWLACAGVLAVPVTGALLAATPTMARATVYVVGLAAIAAISFLGGRLGRRALSAGTALRARALAATIVGLWLGLTAAVLCFWTLLALVV
jgi:uncharacterized membrane protein YuzA (DUF378 family)